MYIILYYVPDNLDYMIISILSMKNMRFWENQEALCHKHSSENWDSLQQNLSNIKINGASGNNGIRTWYIIF